MVAIRRSGLRDLPPLVSDELPQRCCQCHFPRTSAPPALQSCLLCASLPSITHCLGPWHRMGTVLSPSPHWLQICPTDPSSAPQILTQQWRGAPAAKRDSLSLDLGRSQTLPRCPTENKAWMPAGQGKMLLASSWGSLVWMEGMQTRGVEQSFQQWFRLGSLPSQQQGCWEGAARWQDLAETTLLGWPGSLAWAPVPFCR